MMSSARRPSFRPIHALVAFGSAFAAGAIGSLATIPNIPIWYAGLHKPGFTPPNWLFGPVWTLLYILMALSLLRILDLPREARGRRTAMTWFFVQIALNALWSVAFFGLHSPLSGLAVIALLLAAIAATLITFSRLDPVASLLLVPYLLWTAFAAALNAAIALLNR